MSIVYSTLFLVLLAVCALLNLAALPGNWIMAALVAAWTFFAPNTFTSSYFLLFTLFFAGAECIEFLAQAWGSKKFGSSKASTIAGMLCAVVGAITCMPLFLGLGAIPGALAGAWGGCFLAEYFLEKRSTDAAMHAANGALLGRFLGMIIKFGAGLAMVGLTASYMK